MPTEPAHDVVFRDRLPDVAEYSLATDLRSTVERHLTASSLCELLGPPEPWELKREGDLITARLRWTTPEGWDVQLLPYFTVTPRRSGGGWCAYGPWGDGCVAHGSGLILDEVGSYDALATYAQNAAFGIREARKNPDEYRHWYTGETEEETELEAED